MIAFIPYYKPVCKKKNDFQETFSETKSPSLNDMRDFFCLGIWLIWAAIILRI